MPQRKRARVDNEWNQTIVEVRKKMKESGIKAPKLKDVLKEASIVYKAKKEALLVATTPKPPVEDPAPIPAPVVEAPAAAQ